MSNTGNRVHAEEAARDGAQIILLSDYRRRGAGGGDDDAPPRSPIAARRPVTPMQIEVIAPLARRVAGAALARGCAG
jgi:hypothetical protein